jgi:hypothetical protein
VVAAGIFLSEDCLLCGAGAPIRLGTHVQEQVLAEKGSATAEFAGTFYGSATPLLTARQTFEGGGSRRSRFWVRGWRAC